MQPTVPLTNSGSSGSPTAGAAPRVHLLDFDPPELKRWLAAEKLESYRAEQILDWIYQRGAESFEQMTNLSKGLRRWLTERADILRGKVARESLASDGTRKLLLAWPDGGSVETVWIPSPDRQTACISSQVGCPVGCRFCASGINGVERNLTAGEIVEQALRISRMIVAQGAAVNESAVAGEVSAAKLQTDQKKTGYVPAGPRLSNIVMMGMGEPLANYRAVIKAIRTINASWGLGIGARKITLSTVGLPKQIRQLAEEDLQLNLAFSIHAPNDELRREIIPWAEDIPLEDILAACRYYFDQTGREVTLEYVLLDEVNDRPKHADQLARVAKRIRANVNLMRYNPVAGLPFERPSAEASQAFLQRLRINGVNAHIRTSRGLDADAACGQLRRATHAGGSTKPADV